MPVLNIALTSDLRSSLIPRNLCCQRVADFCQGQVKSLETKATLCLDLSEA